MMRRIHVCRADGGDGAWLCNAFTHWTCKRRRSLRRCDKAHYTLQRRNASSFFHGTPRALPPPLLLSAPLRRSNASGEGGAPRRRGTKCIGMAARRHQRVTSTAARHTR